MPSLESYRTIRWIRTVNLLLQAVLFLTLFGGLNYLAIHYHWRYDLSQNHRYTLSPETRSYLAELKRPVRIVVTLTPDAENADVAQAYRDVKNLLREYEYASKANDNGRISVQYLNVYQRRREAEVLGIEQPNALLFICGPHHLIVPYTKLYEWKTPAPDRHVREAFLGEQVVTEKILDVSNPNKKRIYFLTGHGEMSPDDVSANRGLSGLAEQLRLRNFSVESLDLSATKRVPDDASLLIIASPLGRFQPMEEELLRQYLTTRAGRIILTIDPRHDCGLENLLYDWGIRVDDDIVYESSPADKTDDGDLLIRWFAPDNPITKTLLDYGLYVRMGPPRSVRPDPDRSLDSALKVTVLAASSKTSWGEFGYRLKSQASTEFTPGADLKGPLGVAVSSERINAGSLPFSVPGGRLVVIGSGDIFSNRRLADQGCQVLALNSINWCVDSDTQLRLPPRPIKRFQLSLSTEELAKLRLGLLFILPGSVALLGIIVYWTRRR